MENEEKKPVLSRNLWECSLTDLVGLEKELLSGIDDSEEEEGKDLLTLVFAARDMMAGKIDNIVFLHKSAESNLAELKLAYDRHKFRLERMIEKLKAIVEQGIVNRNIGSKINGTLFAANRVGTDSCMVDDPAILPKELTHVEVSIKANFPATEKEEFDYWQEIVAQNMTNKFAKGDISIVPSKLDIKKALKNGPVAGARLETNYHVRFTQPSLTKGKKEPKDESTN